MEPIAAPHWGAGARMKLTKLTGATTRVELVWGAYAAPMLEHPDGLEQSREAIQCSTGVIVRLNGVRNIR